MVKSKCKDVTIQGFCKISASKYLFNFLFEQEGEGGGVRVGAYLS